MARHDSSSPKSRRSLSRSGAGELWGTRQTGLPALRVADLAQDIDLVEAARALAQAWIAADPSLETPASAPLRERLLRDFGEELSWRATG